jgi:hypothetical protein
MIRGLGHWKMIVCMLVAVGLIGCASIMGKGSPETLNIRSTPDQADVAIHDENGMKVFTGKTPTMASLEKKKSYFSGKKYTVKITKPGFADHQTTVDTNAGGWYIGGNILLGGLIGWFIVDPLTGAMWTLDTNELNIPLEASKEPSIEPTVKPPQEPSKESSQAESFKVGVLLLQDVPTALRYKMVKVSQE